MRAITIASNYDYPIIRIDTNQEVYGLGEVRDAGGKDNALIFKGALLGRDPMQIERILRGIRSFSNHGRAGGGYSAIDLALNDIRGKVLGVPLWKLLGVPCAAVVFKCFWAEIPRRSTGSSGRTRYARRRRGACESRPCQVFTGVHGTRISS